MVLAVFGSTDANPLRVVSYNVENLFHPGRDSVNTDSTYTPEGEKRWSYHRYNQKTDNIARVLTNIGEWDGVDVIGLEEVENAAVVKKLCYTLRPGEYGFVHYDSPDRRGIDVALVYKKARIDTIRTKAIGVKPTPNNVLRTSTGPSIEQSSSPIKGGEQEFITRDILYVCAQVDKRDTLHFFVCHLPSQRGGAAESEWKRVAAKRVLQEAVDEVLAADKKAKIIVMGDMNSAPKEDIRGLKNRMLEHGQSPTGRQDYRKGTHKHRGQWSCLDQFYVSEAVDSIATVRIYDAEWIMEPDEKYMGLKPKRTYNGFQYQNGYSDHLPIVLECRR